MYSVTFLPDEKTVKAAKGKSLLEAAAAAGVRINNICGGDGVCGKCRVIVKSGKVVAEPTMFLTRREIQRGVALACHTYVDGDVVVEVPMESRIGGVPQLATEDAIRYGSVSQWVGEGAEFAHVPLARKVYLELPPPTQDDNIPDLERIYRALRSEQDIPVMQTGLSVLHRMPAVLRDNDWKVTVLVGQRGETVEVVDVEGGNKSHENYGVAVDLGTTTVVAHLVDLNTFETLGTKAKYNSQVAYGDDVIARIMYASTPVRCNELRELIVQDVNDLLMALAVDANIRLHDVNYVVGAGNTTMSHLIYGLDPASIRKDPYVSVVSHPPTVRAAEVGININPRGLFCTLPSVASYVGGDIVADVLVSGVTQTEDISLMIDLGTNGELVVGNRDWLICCAASAGPSFEGGGITCGMRATNGAIEHIKLGRHGKIETLRVVGEGKPLGICGSGLVELVGELLRVGCIDRSGRFVRDVCCKRVSEGDGGGLEFLLVDGKHTALGRPITISEADIKNLIHSKGSIYMAAECLLEHVGLTFDDITNVYIAGGFGNYLDVSESIRIGLLPDIDHERFQVIGNGSVQGAKMALLSEPALRYLSTQVAGGMTCLELSVNHKYMNEYSSCLFLPHTDIEKFPSCRDHVEKEPAAAG